jgi:16S rRNA (cytidine1402-2'-O)-methyltransferase
LEERRQTLHGKLYLIPTTLGDSDPILNIPQQVCSAINTIDDYLVENEKSARHYLKKMGIKKPLSELNLQVLDKHTTPGEISKNMEILKSGKNMGVISEAGCPGVADPGSEAVKWAHKNKIQVVPLVGPSSILLGLMASGFNGQCFVFHGYLPIEKSERVKKIKELEKQAQALKQTQIFIETPYRNNHLLDDLLKSCKAETLLCVAVDISLATEKILSQTIADWRKNSIDLHKRPALFLLYK